MFLNNPLYIQVTTKLKNLEDFNYINENKFVISHLYNIANKYNNYGECKIINLFK